MCTVTNTHISENQYALCYQDCDDHKIQFDNVLHV